MHPFPSAKTRVRLSISALVLAVATLSTAEIKYTVQLSPDTTRVLVTMDVPVKKGAKEISVQMPRWSPGGYDYNDSGKDVENFTAKDASGKSLITYHPDFSTWTMAEPPAGHVIFSYAVKQEYANDVLHYSGPSDRKSTRLNSSHIQKSRMPSSA